MRARPTPSAYAELGLAFLERRRRTAEARYFAHAEAALEAAAELDPDDPALLHAMTLMRLDQHRFREACELARRSIVRAPTDSTGELLLGDALFELGDYEAAVDAYQRAIDLRPDLRSYGRGASMRWLHGDVEGALELMGLAIRAGGNARPSDVAWCLVEHGTIFWRAGRSAEALAAAERALVLAPDDPRARLLRARALRQGGQVGEAIGAYEDLVSEQPSPDSLLELAELLRAEGRVVEAERRVQQAVQRTADDPATIALYYARRGLRPGWSLFLAAANLQGHDTIEAHATHALALWRSGRLGEARKASNRALRLGTPDASLYLHRALIERDAGDLDRARHYAERAFEINPSADPLLAGELRGSL